MIRKTFFTAVAAACVLFCSINASAQEVTPDGTYMFVKRDTCDLFLDLYKPTKGSETTFEGKQKPTIIFMFGGGFTSGERDNPRYQIWFKQMNDLGYSVISIDYRLGLKGTSKVGVAQVNVLDKAIHMAVEDLFSATRFIIDNADQLGVNPANIVISGSSAGAISVMQAEYEICNRTSWAQVLPEDFNYAGVMSFAGAILSRKGEVKYAETPAPTLMLHGTSDALVNYRQIKFFNLGFFGGGKLVKRFEKFGYNYNMYHFLGYGHEIAGSMDTTFDIQLDFLQTNVIEGKRRIVEAWVDDPNVYKGAGVQSRKELYGN
jgi:predicted esterase